MPGEEFRYRVLKDGKPVFDASAHARKSARQPFRFVLFGDCGQATPAQNAIAYQAYLAKPDFLFIPGDIVYGSGRISEYRTKFFPMYNADEPSASQRRAAVAFRAVHCRPGNHDTALNNYQRFPDALAYFLYWDQPLNGPVPPADAPKTSHVLTGRTEAQPVFLDAAKPRYPRMANFSFDYGNSHWTVLDANIYMDWSNPALREWLNKDLAAAQSATWRIVAFHQPGFNSSHEHFTEQYMRLLSPIFEAQHVDVVFSGHVHNYQRSFPLTFVPAAARRPVRTRGELAGEWKLDKEFRRWREREAARRDLHRERRRRRWALQSRAAERSRKLAGLHRQVHLRGALAERGRYRRQDVPLEAGLRDWRVRRFIPHHEVAPARGGRGFGEGKLHSEHAALPLFALHRQRGAVSARDPLGDRESQSGAIHLAAGWVGADKAIEDPRQQGFGNPDAAVADRQNSAREADGVTFDFDAAVRAACI